MKVAIHQPNYAPWCGYFAKMWHSEVFVFLRDVQMPQGRSYVSRTKIASSSTVDQWLTVPVVRQRGQLISQVTFADPDWTSSHMKTIHHEYAQAQFYDEVMDILGRLYSAPPPTLAVFNQQLIAAVAEFLGWQGTFAYSDEHPTELSGDDRLVHLTRAVGGTQYVSGAGGDKYQEHSKFHDAGLAIDVKSYDPQPYPQGGEGFTAGLSVLDALFHLGTDAKSLLAYD